MEIRRHAHCVYRCMCHMVWIPRYRYKVLVKGVDEYMLKKMGEIRKRYYGREEIWSAGYFVSTGGLDEKLIEKYVLRYQEQEDLGQARLALDFLCL